MVKEFEKQYNKTKELSEWPPKDAYDLFYSHRIIWGAALKWAIDLMLSFPVSEHDSSHDRSNMIVQIKKEL